MIYFFFLLKLLYYILESIMKEIQNKKVIQKVKRLLKDRIKSKENKQ